MIKLLQPFITVGNIFIRRLLRSRFHWLLSGYVVLLEVTGRNSGRKYLVPVNYRPTADGIRLLTYRHRTWWRNIESGSELPVWLKGRRIITTAEVVTDDPDAIAAGLADRGWIRKAIAPSGARDSLLIRLHIPGSA